MSSSTTSASPIRWERLKSWLRSREIHLLLIILVVLLLLAYFWPDMAFNIKSGEAGVVWKRFDEGTVTVADDGKPFVGRIDGTASGEARALHENLEDKKSEIENENRHLYPYREGIRFIWPWDKMFIYDIRLQMFSYTYDVLMSDGLQVKVEIAFSWKPIEADLGKLHRDIGPNYLNTIMIPIVGSCAREIISGYGPEALYSPTRFSIQEKIREAVKVKMLERFYPKAKRESYFIIEEVLIRSVLLPPQIRDAILDKVAQKQLADSYVYRLQRERQEAERKSIEAEGIRRFQAAINSTISDGYLKWKGIDATLELAKSPNAKIVVIGAGGKDGLPVILGGLDNGQGPTAATLPPR